MEVASPARPSVVAHPATATSDCLHDYAGQPARIAIPESIAKLAKIGVMAADMDADSWPDLVLTTWGGGATPEGRVVVAFGPFDARREPAAVWMSPERDRFAGLAVGDLDQDGVMDIAASIYSLDGDQTAAARVYAGDGARTWRQVFAAPATSRSPTVALGDADGDGDLDLFVGAVDLEGTEPLLTARQRLYRNRGAPPFYGDDDVERSAEGVNAFASRFTDVDGDGRLEIVVTQPGSTWGVQYVDARLAAPTFFTVGGQPNRAFAIAFDEVRRTAARSSLVVAANAHYCSGVYCYNRLFEQGDGCAVSWEGDLGTSLPAALHVADLDGDGNLDLLTGLWTGSDPKVPDAGPLGAFCGGSTRFSTTFSPIPGSSFRTQALALADLDRAGIETRIERWGPGARAIPPGATTLTLPTPTLQRVLQVLVDERPVRALHVPGTQWVGFPQPLSATSVVAVHYEVSTSLDIIVADYSPGFIPVFFKE